MNHKLKILFLLHLPPPVHGSSTVGINIQKSSIINNEFDCHYVNLLASRHLEEEGRINFRKILDFAITFFKLFILIVKKRPKLCYFALTCKGAAFYRDLFFVSLLKLFRIQLVYHLHNKGVSVHKNKTINKICYRFAFNDVDVIILSKHLYADIQDFVPKSKVYICPNGIAILQDINLQVINSNRTTKTVPSILFLSNLIKIKGVYTLLEACKILLNKKILFETFFVGAPNDISEDDFKDFILANNLQENVWYVGKKIDDEKSFYFQQANVFVFPTYHETFGLVNLEAMQFGLPIISTNEGAIPEIIEDGFSGFIIPQKNPEALADKIEYLINDLDRCVEMGMRGREIFEKHYTLEKFELRLTEIFHQISKAGEQCILKE